MKVNRSIYIVHAPATGKARLQQ